MADCSICSSPHRVEVDEALGAGEPYRKVAARYGLGAASTYRHYQNHSGLALPPMPPRIRATAPGAPDATLDAALEAMARNDARAAELAEAAMRETNERLEAALREADERLGRELDELLGQGGF